MLMLLLIYVADDVTDVADHNDDDDTRATLVAYFQLWKILVVIRIHLEAITK